MKKRLVSPARPLWQTIAIILFFAITILFVGRNVFVYHPYKGDMARDSTELLKPLIRGHH